MKRVVLVVGMGTTPAVLTETVWALAHQDKPIIPDEVIVLVTLSGRDKLYREVLSGEKPVWDEMLAALQKEHLAVEGKLVFGEMSIHVIPDGWGNGMVDLRSGEDNLRAADFMLREIRQYTESSDTVVLTSIAGGRKTMSALLFSCMSLLGREDDKVFHVLLPQELEGGVEPTMYYPKKGATYTNRVTGRKYKGEKIQSELFEVPFVRMRGWYLEHFKTIPPSYRTLVSRVQNAAPPAVNYPNLEIDVLNGWVKLDGTFVHLSKTCFAALVFLADGHRVDELSVKLSNLHNGPRVKGCSWLDDFQESTLFQSADVPDDLRHTLSNLRKKLEAAGFTHASTLVPQRKGPVTFPVGTIRWKNRLPFA